MKIIEPGREQRGWSMEMRCTGQGNGGGGCDALLLVERTDVYRTERHALDETTYCNTFKCVSCGVETDMVYTVVLPFAPPPKKTWERRKRGDEHY